MKKIVIISIPFAILVLAAGLYMMMRPKNDDLPFRMIQNETMNETKNTGDEDVNRTEVFLMESNQDENSNGVKSKVTIKGYYSKPKSLMNEKTIVLKGLQEHEYIEFIVEGEITEFEHLELQWDAEIGGLVDKGTLNRLGKVVNQTIVIETYMPEGIPLEKVRWKSASGKTYEFIIREYALGD